MNQKGTGEWAQLVGSGLTQAHRLVCDNFLVCSPQCKGRVPHTPKAGGQGQSFDPALSSVPWE